MRLPLYSGTAYAGTPHAKKVWFILMDASDVGLAHDLGVNYAPKLANIDENQVFNLAASRLDLLTGVNPATGQPAPRGSVGVDINCA